MTAGKVNTVQIDILVKKKKKKLHYFGKKRFCTFCLARATKTKPNQKQSFGRV